MHITIINPKGEEGEVALYMSLLYLGTALHRAGHKVRILDSQIEDSESLLKSLIGTTDLVGITAMSDQIAHGVRLSDIVKEKDPNLPVVWGGVHASLFPEQTVKDKSVDYVVSGEGEHTMLELLECIEGKRKKSSIKGLVYQERGVIRKNPPRPLIDINTLSPPEWKLFKIKEYVRDFVVGDTNYGKSLPVHSGRGCVYRCTFCIHSALKDLRWRPLSAENMFNEVNLLKEHQGISHVRFIDENFFINRKRIMKFSELMISNKMDMKWHALSKANYFNKDHMNSEFMELIKKAGCSVISMGMESGSQRMLDMIKKDIKVEQIINAVKTCKRYEIKPLCSFMAGLPHETKDDLFKTLDLIEKIRKIDPSATVIGPQQYRPYPGTLLYDEIMDKLTDPKSLRGWAESKLVFGYASPRNIPWVDFDDNISDIWFYTTLSGQKNLSLGKGLFSIIARFRTKHKIFSC